MTADPWPSYPGVSPGPSEAQERRARMDAALELSHAYRGAAVLLGQAGERNRDIVDLAMAVGRRLALTGRQLRRLEFGALLHDVGKIELPREMLDRAGPLAAEERNLMEQHTVAGQAMLESAGGLLGEVGEIVRSTHERYGGDGYPDGLAGQGIPIESRIICCCDALGAMTTKSSHRSALPLVEALNRLRRHSGTQFDPDVVDALVTVVAPEL
jgi:HD-GYP domain-containing protein (c-di-GMP phosphodiesterase class II)